MPSLHLGTGNVKAHQPMGIQPFSPEFAVEGLDDGIVCRLLGPGEVENDTGQRLI